MKIFKHMVSFALCSAVIFALSAPAMATEIVICPENMEPAGIILPEDNPSDWAKEYIDRASEVGILPDGLIQKYRDDISREDFCELAMALLEKCGFEVMEPSEDAPMPFDDTDSRAVYTLNMLGVIDGRGDGVFDPDSYIKREEAAKIVTKLSGVLNMPMLMIYYEYADQEDASEWARPYLSNVYAIGVMEGVGEDRFDPKGTLTAEQTIAIMIRLYDRTVM